MTTSVIFVATDPATVVALTTSSAEALVAFKRAVGTKDMFGRVCDEKENSQRLG